VWSEDDIGAHFYVEKEFILFLVDPPKCIVSFKLNEYSLILLKYCRSYPFPFPTNFTDDSVELSLQLRAVHFADG